MTPRDFIDYCLAKTGACEDYPFGLEVTVIKVDGKIFAKFFKLDGKDTATFNADRLMSEFYRAQYPNVVVRGWHCPPVQQPYFNTLPLDGTLDDTVIKEMIDNSYNYVVSKLPKYKQKELKSK